MKKQIWFRPKQVELLAIILRTFKDGVRVQPTLTTKEQTAAQTFTAGQVAELMRLIEPPIDTALSHTK